MCALNQSNIQELIKKEVAKVTEQTHAKPPRERDASIGEKHEDDFDQRARWLHLNSEREEGKAGGRFW